MLANLAYISYICICDAHILYMYILYMYEQAACAACVSPEWPYTMTVMQALLNTTGMHSSPAQLPWVICQTEQRKSMQRSTNSS